MSWYCEISFRLRESSLERKSDDSDQPGSSRSPHQPREREMSSERSGYRDRGGCGRDSETSERRGYRDRGGGGRERERYQGQREHGDGRGRKTFQDNRGRRNDYRTKNQPAPDYVVNPSKWKKYDLSRDGTEGLKRSGMTDDQVNSFAAFQFLRELRERKEREMAAGEEEIEVDSRGERKVLFRKLARRKPDGGRGGSGGDRDSALAGEHKERVFAGGAGAGVGVVKMAEYVGGEGQGGGASGRRARKRKQLQALGEQEDETTPPQKQQRSCISLSHLAELDDED